MDDTDHGRSLIHRDARLAGVIVAAVLFIAYIATLAPGVTYWDAGEFQAAIKTLGIPHPPGTPLYILVGNVWAKLFAPLFGFSYAVNLLSAVCTAAACGVFAYLMARWTRDHWAAIGGGITAGLMSSVWLNANETEVYSPSLLMASLLMLVAYHANTRRETRWLILLAYLLGLAYTLQLSVLVAAPAAIVLAFSGAPDRRIPIKARTLAAMLAVAALGASAVMFMIVRAQHDPGVNQGNPETWSAFADVLTRQQYLPASFLPRQAPWYIQIGNLFEYADWQFALGLHPEAAPSWRRTPFTLVYALLGIVGFAWHRRTDGASWRVMTFLFICGTLGVVAYLNMKASPSYGHGFLPPDAPHEARERDYFFALGFICWGLWAGAGAVRAFARRQSRWALAGGLIVAALPFLLNGPATDRARGPESTAAIDSARRILNGAPPNAVVIAYGDNDTYPVWYAQHVENTRPDVTLVTIPLLGAGWYRAELARRDTLLSDVYVGTWRGYEQTMSAVCTNAKMRGRPVVAHDIPGGPRIPSACKS